MESRPALSRLSQAGKPTPHLLGERAVRKLGGGAVRGRFPAPPPSPSQSGCSSGSGGLHANVFSTWNEATGLGEPGPALRASLKSRRLPPRRSGDPRDRLTGCLGRVERGGVEILLLFLATLRSF